MKDKDMADPNTNDTAAALAAGIDLARAYDRICDVEDIPIALVPQTMRLEVLTKALEVSDARAETPRRRRGTSTHDEVASFIEHVVRFKDADSAIFADIKRVQLTAVLDYHRSGQQPPRWGEHRSVYTCPLSRQWQLWNSMNEKVLTQDAFGDFIDQNLADIASPSAGGAVPTDVAAPAAVLEMARNLIVRTKGDFQRTVNPTTGESTLVTKLENESSSTKIPRAFLLGIPVFENGTLYAVEARVRFQLREGRPSFGFSLYQTDRILRDAFGEVRAKVKAETGLPVFAGSPE